MPRPAASWCQRVNEKAEGALPSLVRTMTSSPGRTGSAHTLARYPRTGRHTASGSPSVYCQCHWQHHDAGVKPGATGSGASPARRVLAGRCQCRWSPGPAAHASGPGPVTGSAGSRTARSDSDLAGAQVQVAARPGPAAPCQRPRGGSHGALLSDSESGPGDKAAGGPHGRPAEPPPSQALAWSTPGALVPTGSGLQVGGPGSRAAEHGGLVEEEERPAARVGSRLQLGAACVPSADSDERAGLLLPSPSAPIVSLMITS